MNKFFWTSGVVRIFFLLLLFILAGGGFSSAFTVQADADQPEKPGITFHHGLESAKRDEIKILNDHAVEVGLGPDRRTVSSTILDAIRSIPSVEKGREPREAYLEGTKIYRQGDGSYSWDLSGKKPVRLVSDFIKGAGGRVRVAVKNQVGPTKAPPSAESTVSRKPGTTRQIADIRGFRSARFGMTPTEVREAIQKDFSLSGEAVKSGTNPLEKTSFLSVVVQKLLPESGPGRIGYIFGYQSGRLIQVNIVWGKPVVSNPHVKGLVNTANLLRSYFFRLGFPRDKLVMNSPLGEDSILAFRGTDKNGKMVSLVLNNPLNKERPGSEASLVLKYAANPGSPDIFQLKKGSF